MSRIRSFLAAESPSRGPGEIQIGFKGIALQDIPTRLPPEAEMAGAIRRSGLRPPGDRHVAGLLRGSQKALDSVARGPNPAGIVAGRPIAVDEHPRRDGMLARERAR